MSHPFKWVVAFGLLALLAAPARCQDAGEIQKLKAQLEAMQKAMAEMRAEMQAKVDAMTEMQARIEAMEKAGERAHTLLKESPMQSLTAPEGGQEQPLSPAITDRKTFSDNPYAVARVDNAPIDPAMRGFFRIKDSETIFRIGGYTKLDIAHDLKPAGYPDYFVTSSIPIGPIESASSTNINVRQTRLNIEFRRPMLGDTVRFFYENDFEGPTAREFNLRHAYGQWRNILAGFTFSTIADPDSLSDTLDFEGPGGVLFQYSPQFRYTWPINKSNSLAVALEKPVSDIRTVMPVPGENVTVTPYTPWADLIVRWRYEADRGHVQVGTITRYVGAYYKDVGKRTWFCYGASFGTAFRTFGKDQFLFQGNWGRGISHYYNDLGGLGYDLGRKEDGTIAPLPVWGYQIAYEHHWTGKLKSSVTYGFMLADTDYLRYPTDFRSTTYLSGNLIWRLGDGFNCGLEVMYGDHVQKDRQRGNATRIQFSFQYDFVK